ncbi:hypothetical protein PIB30_100777, partial [Stylosanthes scabra]|nr:hypothetical protein [Stylosanthes scabra]
LDINYTLNTAAAVLVVVLTSSNDACNNYNIFGINNNNSNVFPPSSVQLISAQNMSTVMGQQLRSGGVGGNC